ncbi:MAG: 23S rRNA (adenine(2503)-C(2))-methyltransferase RlmN [Patescibacteria group bacterium]|jgi:23S rRNA (adenine2503-C2)-methyltransferase
MFNNLQTILSGQPKYRQKQVQQAIYGDFIDTWEKATTLPLALRLQLQKEYPLDINAKLLFSEDKQSIKGLITLKDNSKIETVLMRHEDGRNTVCVSTQVGCPMDCDFCATGKLGLKRNLTTDEIIKQVLLFSRYLKKEDHRVSGVVFMGMGEPFLNFMNFIEAIKILNDKEAFNIGSRHISISTCGVIEGIKKIANFPLQVNLALSLHAPNNELRSKLMPANKRFPLDKVLDALANYIKKTKRRVMIEYIMLDKINDSPAQAKELAKLLKNKLGGLFFVNLIAYNFSGQINYKPSSSEAIAAFKAVLEKEKITVTQRYRFGREISAACGQLAGE